MMRKDIEDLNKMRKKIDDLNTVSNKIKDLEERFVRSKKQL